MKFRNTWILAGVVVIFGLYLYFGEYKKAALEEAQKAAEAKVFNFDEGSVKKVEIKNANGAFIVSKADDKNWKLESPLQDNADEGMVNGIVNSLTNAKFEQTIEGQELKNFGLDNPKTSVTLTLKDGAVKKVNVGNDAPIAGKVYLQRDSDPKVLFADATFKTQLDRSVKDLRDKKIFRHTKDQIQSLLIKYNLKDNHSTVGLVKKGDEWDLQNAQNEKADQEMVAGLINNIDNLRATDFPSEKATDPNELKKYGLDHAQIFIRIEDKDHHPLTEISVSPKKDNNVFIRVAGEKTIYQSFGGAADQLIHTAADFEDKKAPFDIKKDDIHEIILSFGQNNEHLVKDAINWKLAEPDPKKEVSQIQVQSILDKIASLRISEFARDEKPKGLDSPRGTLVLKDDKGKDLLSMSWGDETKSKRSYFTKSSKVDYIFGTDSTSLNGIVSSPVITAKVDPKDPRRVTETNANGGGKAPAVPAAPGAGPGSGAAPAKPEVIDLKSAPASK